MPDARAVADLGTRIDDCSFMHDSSAHFGITPSMSFAERNSPPA
jgi:hypothetical protein